MRNYKLLKYSWETDPKVKAWKDAREKWRIERSNSSKTFPLKTEWKEIVNAPPTKLPDLPPDPRTDEQFNNDYFLDQCRQWDYYQEKKHIRDIKEYKSRIRRDLREARKISQTWNKVDFLGRTVESKLEDATRSEYIYAPDNPKYTIHLFDYIDYVNVRFGLNIRKDILTDKEYEKSKLIIDVAPVKTIEGAVNGK